MSETISPNPTPEPRFRYAVPLVLLALVGTFLLGRFTGVTGPTLPEKPAVEEPKPAEEKGVVRFEEAGLKLADLKLATVTESAIVPRLNVMGQVEPNPSGTVTVTPRVEGKVIKLLVSIGDSVQAGQVLAIIESEKLHEAQVAHRLAVKREILARQVLERRQKLAALGEYGRPALEQSRTQVVQIQGEVQKAESELSAAQAAIAQAASQVRSMQVALKQAQTQQSVAETRAARAESLYKEELLSRQDWEQSRAEKEKAAADVEAARAHIAQGEAQQTGAESRRTAAFAALETVRKQREAALSVQRRAEAVYRGNYATGKEVEEARSAYQQAQIETEGALDDVELLGGKPDDLHEIPIKAPIAGKVTERPVTLGQTIAAGTPMLTLLNARSVWVQFAVYAQDLSGVKVGQNVTAISESVPGTTFQGVVAYISETVDAKTRTAKVRAVFQNNGTSLRPGSFVNGTLAETAKKRGIVVPQDAVQEVDGKTVVYTPGTKEGEFREKSVETGERSEGKVEIVSGLKAGEKIVVQNAFLIKSQAMKSELGEE